MQASLKSTRATLPQWLSPPLLMASILTFSGCASPQQQIAQKEDHLAAAGFVFQPASTPQRQAMLDRLPPNRFERHVQGATVTYVYGDPYVCGCLYVGTQQAYGRYQAYLEQRNLVNRQEMAAQEWSDANWDWGGWGPWGPGIAFVPGPGW